MKNIFKLYRNHSKMLSETLLIRGIINIDTYNGFYINFNKIYYDLIKNEKL